jgi:hypothetical protein
VLASRIEPRVGGLGKTWLMGEQIIRRRHAQLAQSEPVHLYIQVLDSPIESSFKLDDPRCPGRPEQQVAAAGHAQPNEQVPQHLPLEAATVMEDHDKACKTLPTRTDTNLHLWKAALNGIRAAAAPVRAVVQMEGLSVYDEGSPADPIYVGQAQHQGSQGVHKRLDPQAI